MSRVIAFSVDILHCFPLSNLLSFSDTTMFSPIQPSVYTVDSPRAKTSHIVNKSVSMDSVHYSILSTRISHSYIRIMALNAVLETKQKLVWENYIDNFFILNLSYF